MSFTDLVEYKNEFNVKKTETLIIIPFFSEYQALFENLECLSKQTYQNFNAIIISGIVSDERKIEQYIKEKMFKFGIVIAKRKEDTGSAGGFGTGQRYALEEGYKYMILADVDCLPKNPGLVKALMANKNSGYVRPVVDEIDNNGNVVSQYKTGNIPAYSLLSAEVVMKYGTYYPPVYYGGDDVEYIQRIKQKPVVIADTRCEHPFIVERYYKNLDKYSLFLVNLLAVSDNLKQLVVYFVNFLFSSLSFLIFFPAYGQKLAKGMLGSLLTFTYGKKALENIRSGYENYIVSLKIAEEDNCKMEDYNTSFTTDDKYALMPLKIIYSCFRKRILIKRTKSGFLNTLTAIVSKKTYFQLDNNRCILLADNGDGINHGLRLLAFIILLPTIGLLSLIIFIPQKILRRPNSYRYGLEGLKGST